LKENIISYKRKSCPCLWSHMGSGGIHSPHPRLCSRCRWAGGFHSQSPSFHGKSPPYPFYRWVSWNKALWIFCKTQNLFSLPSNELRTFGRVTRSLCPSRYLISSVATSLYESLKISTASVLFISVCDVRRRNGSHSSFRLSSVAYQMTYANTENTRYTSRSN